MKVYISGPMTGIQELNFGEFEDAERILIAKGHQPVNPHKIHGAETGEYEDYLRRDILALMDCNAVFMLPGWSLSNGARIEFGLAMEVGIKAFFSWAEVPLE